MSYYTMLSKYGNCTRLLKIFRKAENRLFLQIKSGRILDILWAFLIKQLVGYEMIMAICHFLPNVHFIVNYTEDFIT